MGYKDLCCVSVDWSADGLLFDIGGIMIENWILQIIIGSIGIILGVFIMVILEDYFS